MKKITKPTPEDKEMENNLKEPTKIKKKVGRQRVKDVIKNRIKEKRRGQLKMLKDNTKMVHFM